MARRIAWVLILAMLGVTGTLGLYNGVSEWGDARTGLQRSVTAAVLLYGVAGLVSTYGLVLRRRWSVWAAVVWGVGAAYAGTVAAVAYGGQDATAVGVLAAGIASVLLVAATIWGVRVATRGEAAKVDNVRDQC
jgi:hypothetical protein